MKIPQHSYLVDLVGWAPPDPEARYRPTWNNWVSWGGIVLACVVVAVVAMAANGMIPLRW